MAGRKGLSLSKSLSQPRKLDLRARLYEFWEKKKENQGNLDGVDLERMSMFTDVDPSIQENMENLGRNPEDKSLQRAVYLLMLDACLNRFKEDPAAWEVLADFMAGPGESEKMRNILEQIRQDHSKDAEEESAPTPKKRKPVTDERKEVATKAAQTVSLGRRFKTQPAGPRQGPRTIRRGESGQWFMPNR